MSDTSFLRIRELALRSGVPITTIRHYAKEGLLGPARKTSRNMAYYPTEALSRIALVKTLQDELFLPLKVVKKLIEAYDELEPDPQDLDLLLGVRDRLLERHPGLLPEVSDIPASIVEQLELTDAEVRSIEEAGIVTPARKDGQKTYDEADYRILKALSGVRTAGLGTELARADDLSVYVATIKKLARIEAVLFARRVRELSPEDDVAGLVARVIPAVNDVICALHHKFLLGELRAPRSRKAKAVGHEDETDHRRER